MYTHTCTHTNTKWWNQFISLFSHYSHCHNPYFLYTISLLSCTVSLSLTSFLQLFLTLLTPSHHLTLFLSSSTYYSLTSCSRLFLTVLLTSPPVSSFLALPEGYVAPLSACGGFPLDGSPVPHKSHLWWDWNPQRAAYKADALLKLS